MTHQIRHILASGPKLILPASAVASSLIAAATVLAPAVRAQAQADSHPPVFDVASIKPSAVPVGREGGNRFRIDHTPTSVTMSNVSVGDCVQWAYDVASFQIEAGHLSTDSYDILAKTDAPVPVSRLRMMLQNLLAARFKLELHRETKMLPVYELVAAKGASKLPAPNTGPPRPLVHAAESLPQVQNDSFLFSDVSMPEFARMLAQLRGIDLPVVDHTGIAGTFDIALKSAPAAAREADREALFAIVRDQLGLKLTPAKAPLEVLVIDHAEKPGAN
jgi:uncharacterized protein (TIGR03435 family)